MMEKALVAYASKYGATAGIADKIAEILRNAGKQVDLLPVREVASLDNYGTVILGSAVYYGRWRREAVNFLKEREKALKDKQVWFFSSGPIDEGDPVELLDGWTFPSLQQEIADRVQPRDIAVFHGVMDEKKLNFIEKWILKKMDTPSGDFRDWELITRWAEDIAKQI
jgi:menaquinone-dependent protoporphyrinogen oxidase